MVDLLLAIGPGAMNGEGLVDVFMLLVGFVALGFVAVGAIGALAVVAGAAVTAALVRDATRAR